MFDRRGPLYVVPAERRWFRDLIVMLLGHWIEMRSVMNASGALVMSVSTVIVAINSRLLKMPTGG